jgi:hypothetical protein
MPRAEPIPLTLDSPGGGEPLRLAWDRRVAETIADGEASGLPVSPWLVEGGLDWRATEALRLVSAVFADGRALALATLRPREAQGHDRDSIAHRLEEPGEGEPVPLIDALLSTEYDADGLPRRLGIELWAESESPPLRIAADREGGGDVGGNGIRREVARMAFRLEGAGGTGTYELLRAE